jgi:hypothetical protein
MKHQGIKGKWDDGKNSIKVELPVMLFEEDGSLIAYIPVLDISGYGKNEEEAKASLSTCLDEYFSYTIHKKTLIEDLRAHGWTIVKKNKPFIAPDITDILTSNKYLHNIVNSRQFKMDRMNVAMPQYADC